ncbi:hypothetical protein P3X46_008292 [Hevea brasiliensis]|uniref:Bulb-type lectin domain-containing protein n=1 Tax=Hevea brasiliensis TaxID=3981 RepID=A0ABQ9MKS8_HEVBR|nr:hypothetical protein P3X46_008292 [Hevea brasiliensis]
MACTSFILLITIPYLFSLNCISYAETDTLEQGWLLQDWEHLISASGVIRLGFFNPNQTYSVELGPSEDPVPDSCGALTIDGDGKLKITYQGGLPIFINPDMAAKNLGNIVIRQVNSSGIAGTILWQSFDYPHNMLLPGMKLGMNLKTGHNWSLTSWLSEKVPDPGAFKLGLDPSGANELSSGVWQNGSFQSAPRLTRRNDAYNFRFVANKDEKYFLYSKKTKSVLFTIDGRIGYETTGPCKHNSKNPIAVCLTERPTKCRNGSGVFMPKRGLINYNWYTWYYDSDVNSAISDYHAKCWKNCTCIAYKSISDDGTGCKFWSKGSKFILDDNLNFIYLLKHENSEDNRV